MINLKVLEDIASVSKKENICGQRYLAEIAKTRPAA